MASAPSNSAQQGSAGAPGLQTLADGGGKAGRDQKRGQYVHHFVPFSAFRLPFWRDLQCHCGCLERRQHNADNAVLLGNLLAQFSCVGIKLRLLGNSKAQVEKLLRAACRQGTCRGQ